MPDELPAVDEIQRRRAEAEINAANGAAAGAKRQLELQEHRNAAAELTMQFVARARDLHMEPELSETPIVDGICRFEGYPLWVHTPRGGPIFSIAVAVPPMRYWTRTTEWFHRRGLFGRNLDASGTSSQRRSVDAEHAVKEVVFFLGYPGDSRLTGGQEPTSYQLVTVASADFLSSYTLDEISTKLTERLVAGPPTTYTQPAS